MKKLTPVPWLAEGAREWLEERIEPSWTAFEWGSGGSTLWLEGLCASVISVEHDEAWFWKVAARVRVSTMLMWSPPTERVLGDDPANPDHYRSSCVPGNFRWYAHSIDLERPDLVIVDGRARASCIARTVARGPKLLVLDNAEREWYLENTIHLLDGWERTDFREGDWVTSAWMRG